MLNCIELTALFSEGQERELKLREKLSIKMHTAMCSGCRQYCKHVTALREISREYAKRGDDDLSLNVE